MVSPPLHFYYTTEPHVYGRDGPPRNANTTSATSSSTPTPPSPAQPPEFPKSYFLYGSLTDPTALQTVLGIDTRPRLDTARLFGYKRTIRSTASTVTPWPAEFSEWAADRPIGGKVYKVRSKDEEDKLKAYVDVRVGLDRGWKVQTVDIEIWKALRAKKWVIGRSFVVDEDEVEERWVAGLKDDREMAFEKDGELQEGEVGIEDSSTTSEFGLAMPGEGLDDATLESGISTQRTEHISPTEACSSEKGPRRKAGLGSAIGHVAAETTSRSNSSPSLITRLRSGMDLETSEEKVANHSKRPFEYIQPTTLHEAPPLLRLALAQRLSWDQIFSSRLKALRKQEGTSESSSEAEPDCGDSDNQTSLDHSDKVSHERRAPSLNPTRVPLPLSSHSSLVNEAAGSLYTFFDDSETSIVTDSEAAKIHAQDFGQEDIEEETVPATAEADEQSQVVEEQCEDRVAASDTAQLTLLGGSLPPKRLRSASERIKERVQMYNGLSSSDGTEEAKPVLNV